MIGEGKRPNAPWGAFPLTELTVLAALVAGGFALASWGTPHGITLAAAATALGCLSGFELTVREHFAGYRSHCLALAGVASFALSIGSGLLVDTLLVPLVVFGVTFATGGLWLRRRFLAASAAACGVRRAVEEAWRVRSRPRARVSL